MSGSPIIQGGKLVGAVTHVLVNDPTTGYGIFIENELSGEFAIGIIEKTFKNKLYFKSFDADGIWDDAGLEIPYSQITTVKWATRYAEVWQKYLRNE